MSNFHPLAVVGCGSKTQLQMGENCNKITSGKWVKRSYVLHEWDNGAQRLKVHSSHCNVCDSVLEYF